MLSKTKIQYVASLQQKKFRDQYTTFVVEGEKMVREALQVPHLTVEHIFATADWVAEQPLRLPRQREQLTLVTPKDMARISAFSTPSTVLLVARQFAPPTDLPTLSQAFYFYLDQLQDPGNMGTLLRICHWFGIPQLFVSPDCVDIYNPKVVQASMSGIFHVQVITTPLAALSKQYNNALHIVAADMKGTPIYTFQRPAQPLLIVLGNEGRGISAQAAAQVAAHLSIPRARHSQAESLNAAVAAGIIAGVLSARWGVG